MFETNNADILLVSCEMLGYHVGKDKKGSMINSLRAAYTNLSGFGIGPKCAQIFVTGPQSRKETLGDVEKEAIRQFVTGNEMLLIIHGAYVDAPWSRKPGTVANIQKEMEICLAVGAVGLVIHLGSKAADATVLAEVLREIEAGVSEAALRAVTLYLEINAAKATGCTFETSEKLNQLFVNVEAAGLRGLSVGLCIDTAHLHALGQTLTTKETMSEWLEGLPEGVPLLLHLNDSKTTSGSGKDAHEALGHGNVWPAMAGAPSELGLVTILAWAEEKKVPTILERGEGLEGDLALINSLGFFTVT